MCVGVVVVGGQQAGRGEDSSSSVYSCVIDLMNFFDLEDRVGTIFTGA